MTFPPEKVRLASTLRDVAQGVISSDGSRRKELMLDAARMLTRAELVSGVCPACEGSSLFLGDSGHVTCSSAGCPEPTAADRLLHGDLGLEHLAPPPPRNVIAPGEVGEVGKPPQHYAGAGGLQPFRIIDAFGLDFYEGSALKYLLRWRRKNGIEDLKKAIHYIQEVIERAE